MEKSIYEPELDRIKRMDVRDATELFRQLLWCESERLGLKNIRVSSDTDTADGGIDASAERVDQTSTTKGDLDRKSTRLNSSHLRTSRMPSSA